MALHTILIWGRKFVGTEILWGRTFLGRQKFWGRKILGTENPLGRKILGDGKFFGTDNCCHTHERTKYMQLYNVRYKLQLKIQMGWSSGHKNSFWPHLLTFILRVSFLLIESCCFKKHLFFPKV